jgi:hypothetical protein
MASELVDTPDESLEVRLRGLVLDSSPGLRERLAADPAATLELISIAQTAQRTTDEILSDAVRAAREAEHSWSTIGEVLAMSKQAAQQRFGRDRAAAVDVHDDPLRQNLHGLNAFNEMARLNEVGRYGWHSVGFGVMFHTVEKSDVQWEHLRVTVGIGTPGDGWTRVGGMWFPWVYYARPTTQAALPEP